MKQFFLKPHLFFFPASILMGALGFIIPPESFDFPIGSTEYVVNNTFGFHLFGVLGILMAYGYWFTVRANKPLSYRMNALHVAASALGPICIWITSLFYRSMVPVKKDLVSDLSHNANISLIILAFFLITAVVQFIYPFNLLQAFLKGKENT